MTGCFKRGVLTKATCGASRKMTIEPPSISEARPASSRNVGTLNFLP